MLKAPAVVGEQLDLLLVQDVCLRRASRPSQELGEGLDEVSALPRVAAAGPESGAEES
jgi:hypothetical protein